jgi:hypothetical protein
MLYFALFRSKLEYTSIAEYLNFYWRQQAWTHPVEVYSPLLLLFFLYLKSITVVTVVQFSFLDVAAE